MEKDKKPSDKRIKANRGISTKHKSDLVNNFANYTAKEMGKIYAEAQKQLKIIIQKHLEKTEWTLVEFKKFERDIQLFKEINEQIVLAGGKAETLLASHLEIMVGDTILTDAYFMECFEGVKTNLNILNPAVIKEVANKNWLGASYSDIIWKNTEQLKFVLKDQLMQSMILGESPRKLADRIKKVMGSSTYNAMRLARTEMISASARAQKQFAKDNADVVAGMEWVAHLDNRTSQSCKEHNGEVKTITEWEHSPHQIPCHPNCRCSYAMAVKEKYKIKKDIQSFDDWLKEKRALGQIIDGQGYLKPKKPKLN